MTKSAKIELATSSSIIGYAIVIFQTVVAFLYWQYDWQDFRFHILGLAFISVQYILVWKMKKEK